MKNLIIFLIGLSFISFIGIGINGINNLKIDTIQLENEILRSELQWQRDLWRRIPIDSLNSNYYMTDRELGIVISAFAEAYELEPRTVRTIIDIESNGNPLAVSCKGARGLMQIMPNTAIGDYNVHPDKLFIPWVNIRIGCSYFSKMLYKFNDFNTALVAYNAGPGNAKKIRNTNSFPYVQRFYEVY